MADAVLRAEQITKWYRSRAGRIPALNGVTVELRPGESVALIGESGSGKTVFSEILAGLQAPTGGSVLRHGRFQMIFQNPFESLNPRLTIAESVAEPLRFVSGVSREDQARRVAVVLEEVGLPPAVFATRYPHECSGGELQRVAIARALVARPDFLIADEPTTMLDVSVRAAILGLLKRLQQEHGIGILLITHDFSGVHAICDRILVIYKGRLVEEGSSDAVLFHPLHPYTQALISAIPQMDPDVPIRVPETPPSEADTTGQGCPFVARCQLGEAACRHTLPELLEVVPGHRAACLVQQAQQKASMESQSAREAHP